MLELRDAREADIPFMIALRTKTMHVHLLNSGAPVTNDNQLARVMYRFECAKIVVLDGKDIGILKVDTQSVPRELIQIQISPHVQRGGIGEALIRQVILDAERAGSMVELSVPIASPAKRLYERCGFELVNKAEFQYIMRTRHNSQLNSDASHRLA